MVEYPFSSTRSMCPKVLSRLEASFRSASQEVYLNRAPCIGLKLGDEIRICSELEILAATADDLDLAEDIEKVEAESA